MKTAIATLETMLATEQLLLTEVEVAALLRDGSLKDEDRWVQAENFGLAVVANLEEHVASFDPNDVDGGTDHLLTLAAHTLWSAAQRRFLLQDISEATFLALNAAIAFLYGANVSGAGAIAQEISQWTAGDPVFELLRYLIAVLRLVPDPDIPRKRRSVDELRHYYRLHLDHAHSADFDLYTSVLTDLDVPEHTLTIPHMALIYRLERAFGWLARFLLPDLLERFFGQRNEYTAYVRQRGPFFAFPSQRQAIVQLTDQPRANTLITYPTSTGKTFLGQLLALEPLIKGTHGVAVYVAPYRAIVNQIEERDRRLIEAAGISFVRAMGGYMEALADVTISNRVFLVATPEAFDYALRVKPDLANRLVAIVIDELHLIEQSGRGTLLECLVGRLRDLQRTQSMHIIGLSAVIRETQALQRWLDVPDTHVLQTQWTPGRKRFEIQLANNKARFYSDTLRISATDPPFQHQLAWKFSSPVSKIPYQGDPRYRKHQTRAYDQIANTAARMAAEMYNRFRGSVLVVCASKSDTRTLARKLLPYMERDLDETTSQQRLQRIIEQRYPHYRTLLTMLPYRVCYHNADIEYEVRDLLQTLIEERYFKVVVATTTLAEGVDLPFRAVIMYRWTHRDGNNRKLFSTLLMRNIVGRCGRAGMFVEGDTIFFDNPADDPYYDGERTNTIEQTYIYPRSIQLRSSLETTSSQSLAESDTVVPLESSLLALIHQRQSIVEPVEQFSQLLLADPDSRTGFQEYLLETLGAELRKGPQALVTANSPVRLTAYGQAAVQTGLSMQSAAMIAEHLSDLRQPYSRPAKKRQIISEYNLHWNGWLERAIDVLATMRELTDRDPPPKDVFPLLVWGWYSGWSLPSLVWMRHYRNKRETEPVVQWLINPDEPNEYLEEQIAKIQGFCDRYFVHSWTHVLRAVMVFLQFSPFEDTEVMHANYQQLLAYVSYGVSEPLAVQLLTNVPHFPGERMHAQIVATWYKAHGVSNLDAVKTRSIMPNPEALHTISLDPLGISRLTIPTAAEICTWLRGISK